jgi:hypothetical protein
MQSYQERDGSITERFITAPSDAELKRRLRAERQAAKDRGATLIMEAVLDPDKLCPCNSGRKTRNCCLKRYRRLMAQAGERVPPLPVELEKTPRGE